MRCELEADLAEVGTARRFIRANLVDVSPGLNADAQLVASELVTNAIRHAQPPLAIEVVADATTATVKVSDGDVARLPVLGPHTSTALAGGGRGLRIVDRLASQWGVELGGSSKTVWFTAG